MIEHRGEGVARCQAARGVEAADQRGAGGGGKRVNRESTCKQATRETNNVGAAGCSPPNEAGRQEAGVRQPGKQARVRSLRARPLRRFGVTHRVSACSTCQIARAASGESPPYDCTCTGSFEQLHRRPRRRRRRRFENLPKFGSGRECGARAGAVRRIHFGRSRRCREKKRGERMSDGRGGKRGRGTVLLLIKHTAEFFVPR